MNPILLIDGDILVYKSISATERELEFEPGVFVMQSDLNDAKDGFVTALATVVRQAEEAIGGPASKVIFCLTDTTNWRKDIYPSYKSNRKNVRKPMGFADFRQWVVDGYQPVIKPTLEADDVIGILATKPGNDAVVWSIDKDFMQIPGKHLIDGAIQIVTEASADTVHFTQTLTGDATDGYPGCPGIGKVKAEKLLSKMPDGPIDPEISHNEWRWPLIVKAYEAKGLTEADALVQARIARICRWQDWDQKAQRVKLWTP
jgi:DNA polymerase-1